MTVQSLSQAAADPTPQDLIDRATAMIPLLRARAAADETDRRIDDDTIEQMVEAGLFRVLQAKRWGGYEMSPEVFAEIQIQLAKGDLSVAWVYGVVGVHPYHLCLFDDQAAQDVWGQDSAVLISSPYMPTMQVKSVDGGYEMSGRWSYSSGSLHCPWTLLGGFVDGNPAGYRSFLIPREEAKIQDTWDTLGLAATGSHDVVVERAFVPEHRTHKFSDGFNVTNPGLAWNNSLIFRMPFMQVFLRAITNGQIGALETILEQTIEYTRSKIVMGKPLSADPDLQGAIGQASAAIAEMRSTIRSDFDRLAVYAERNELPPMAERLMFKYHSAEVAGRCVDLADALLRTTGSGLVYKKFGLERIFRNMLTGRQHAAAGYLGYGRTLGAHLLGQDVTDILC
jgi:3-hydroxy-9,10-secoandrosta-1,3,5(10)-triene-9,17-dione monooxygenase